MNAGMCMKINHDIIKLNSFLKQVQFGICAFKIMMDYVIVLLFYIQKTLTVILILLN